MNRPSRLSFRIAISEDGCVHELVNVDVGHNDAHFSKTQRDGTLASRRLARLRPAAEWEACAGDVLPANVAVYPWPAARRSRASRRDASVPIRLSAQPARTTAVARSARGCRTA